jgi:hypothetical protein
VSFTFRKLYADVVAADGTVGIAYLSWLDAWGIRSAMAGVELYARDGRRQVIRASGSPRPLDPNAIAERWEQILEFEDGCLELRYSGGSCGWNPPGDPPSEALAWRVLMPQGEALWQWQGSSRRPELYGAGYIDFVEIRRLPRNLGLAGLEWGRIHLGRSAVVFSALTFGSGQRWQRAVWDGEPDRYDVGDEFTLRTVPGTTHLRFRDAAGPPAPHVVLNAARILHDGAGLDRARFPSVCERFATRVLGGPLRERRWLSVAHEPSRPTVSGWAIHERVSFGAAAAR